MANTSTKPVYKFLCIRNQSATCNKITSDQSHPVLIFGKVGKDTPVEFESVSGIALNPSDCFLKKICVPGKKRLLQWTSADGCRDPETAVTRAHDSSADQQIVGSGNENVWNKADYIEARLQSNDFLIAA